MKLMGRSAKLHKVLLILSLGLVCHLCQAAEMEEGSGTYEPSPEELAWEKWGNLALVDLANSEIPWMRASLAVHLATRKDPALSAIGHEKFAAIAVLPTSDPLTLWHLARYCIIFDQSSTCQDQKIIERLALADSGNMATLLVVNQHQSGEGWSTPDVRAPASQELLQELASAEVYDEYWGRGASQLLEVLADYSREHPLPAIPQKVKDLNQHPEIFVIFPIIMMDGFSPGFSKLHNLCKTLAETGEKTAIDQCLQIARTLQLDSRTTLARNMGIRLEWVVQNATHPGSAESLFAARKRAVVRKSGLCAIPVLLQGRGDVVLEETLITRWNTAWLQDVDKIGEVQASRRAAEREYASYPDQYPADPSSCPDVLTMNSAEMAEYLAEDDPALRPEFSRPQPTSGM
jgi:hypothetical protein